MALTTSLIPLEATRRQAPPRCPYASLGLFLHRVLASSISQIAVLASRDPQFLPNYLSKHRQIATNSTQDLPREARGELFSAGGCKRAPCCSGWWTRAWSAASLVTRFPRQSKSKTRGREKRDERRYVPVVVPATVANSTLRTSFLTWRVAPLPSPPMPQSDSTPGRVLEQREGSTLLLAASAPARFVP